MSGTTLAIMGFGGIVAVAGIAMLVLGKGKGRNTVKAFGAEFALSNPGVVVFLVGAALVVTPFFAGGSLQPGSAAPAAGSDVTPSSSSTPAPTPSAAPASSDVASAGETDDPAPASAAPALTAEAEPNDAFTSASPVAIGATVRGQLAKTDVDYFRFHTSSTYADGVRVRLEVSRDAQFTLRVYDSQKNQLLEQFLAFEPTYEQTFVAAPDTDYVIELENRPGWTAATYAFTLTERSASSLRPPTER